MEAKFVPVPLVYNTVFHHEEHGEVFHQPFFKKIWICHQLLCSVDVWEGWIVGIKISVTNNTFQKLI